MTILTDVGKDGTNKLRPCKINTTRRENRWFFLADGMEDTVPEAIASEMAVTDLGAAVWLSLEIEMVN